MRGNLKLGTRPAWKQHRMGLPCCMACRSTKVLALPLAAGDDEDEHNACEIFDAYLDPLQLLQQMEQETHGEDQGQPTLEPFQILRCAINTAAMDLTAHTRRPPCASHGSQLVSQPEPPVPACALPQDSERSHQAAPEGGAR